MKPKAIIIEDDLTLSTVFSKAIEAADFEIELYHDGQQALDRLRTAVPDLILLDLHLPNVSGLEILAYLKSKPKFKSTSIVVASADAALTAGLREQVDLVLEKPVSFHQLRSLTARLRPRN